MVAYSIKDLECLSGVKAHTLRIWEKRYGIIQPNRTDTNIRYYEDNDLQKILNITLLNRKGFKISKIATMSMEEICQKVGELTEVGSVFEDQLDSLMMSMFELDEVKFNLILEHQIHSKGFELTISNIVYPLLEKLSVMWIAGSIKSVHENFVINIIRRKIIVEIDRISNKDDPNQNLRCIVYLPENETHELSLLFLHYILVSYNAKVINLGIGVSLVDVLEVKNIFMAKYIFTIFNDSSETPLQAYINELAKNAKDTKILISGFQTATQKLELPQNVRILNSIQDVKDFIISNSKLNK
ncbi:MAG: MerR family transcriptional regulator [Saprospiraceae bacterium]|nr:MerR family transcriptional regulator [Saprospiraceae bacterium]